MPVNINKELVFKVRELSLKKKRLGEENCSAPELFDEAVSRFLSCENRKLIRASQDKNNAERKVSNSC
jgi:hypothetical protein